MPLSLIAQKPERNEQLIIIIAQRNRRRLHRFKKNRKINREGNAVQADIEFTELTFYNNIKHIPTLQHPQRYYYMKYHMGDWSNLNVQDCRTE
jgi:hypothetical protein